jgi:transcriptional repressor NrdR
LGCQRRFTTYEKVELALPAVVKKDDRREAFNRTKIFNGIKRACEKRPISINVIEGVVDRIEQEIQDSGEKEINCSQIGERVMKALHDLDAVAYVRFASVYREFKDVGDFMVEVRDLLVGKKKATKGEL